MVRLASTLLMVFLLFINFSSCKKAVDQIQENAAYDIITKGQWKVTKFEKSGTSIYPEYAEFVFQFFRNGVVTAMQPGSPDVNGNWSASTENLSITAGFPGQDVPLKRFNGTWLITKITETSVEGINGGGSEPYTVALKKL